MITMDFKSDLIKIIKDDLKSNKINYNGVPDDKLIYYFIDRKNRFVDTTTLSCIKYSKEYHKTLKSLTPKERVWANEIEQEVKNKKSLTKLLSKTIFKPIDNNIDNLLKNWNIHHIHLSEKRTSTLLFFTIDNNTIYFINFLKHPKGNTWFNRELLYIIDNNWPWLLQKLPGATAISPDYSDGKIHKLSLTHLIFVQLGTKVLAPTKLGVSSSGISNHAVKIRNYILESFILCQAEIQKHEANIIECIKKYINPNPCNNLHFTLLITDDYFIAYEKNNNIKINLFENPMRSKFLL